MARRQRRTSSRRSLRRSARDRPVVTQRAVAVVQARMTSTRLPGKVTLPLAGRPLLVRVMERVARTPGLAGVCLAIPTGEALILDRLPDRRAWRLTVDQPADYR